MRKNTAIIQPGSTPVFQKYRAPFRPAAVSPRLGGRLRSAVTETRESRLRGIPAPEFEQPPFIGPSVPHCAGRQASRHRSRMGAVIEKQTGPESGFAMKIVAPVTARRLSQFVGNRDYRISGFREARAGDARGGPRWLDRDRGRMSGIFCSNILTGEGAEDDSEKTR